MKAPALMQNRKTERNERNWKRGMKIKTCKNIALKAVQLSQL